MPNRPRVIAVIPCRYGSTRFPGKPLARLAGKPLLWHVHQRCREAQLIDEAVIATDDNRIATTCAELGIPYQMTGEHPTGTDRVGECAKHLDADIYVNVQGDEPFVSPTAIDAVATALLGSAPATIANAYAELSTPAAVLNHNIVKVTLRHDGTALAFSRQPIPYPRGGTNTTYLRQLGLYAFTPAALHNFSTLRVGPLEEVEGIEMYRPLEHSLPVTMVRVVDDAMPVDTPEDLERSARRLARPSR